MEKSVSPLENKFFTDIVAQHDLILHTLIINAFMLHPDDGPWRMEYIYKALMRHIADQNIIAVSQGLRPETAHSGLAVLLTNCVASLGGWPTFYQSLTVFRKDPIEKDFLDRFSKGYIAGYILNFALRNKTSITSAINHVLSQNQEGSTSLENEDKLNIEGLNIKLTEANLSQNIWPQYKRAAHLWASLNNFMKSAEDNPLDSQVFINISTLKSLNPHFPHEGIEGFMNLAAEYLERASKFTPLRSNKTLLNREEALEIFFPLASSVTP